MPQHSPLPSMPPIASTPPTQRIAAIDIARFLGIFLVYYGHVVERMMYLGNQSAGLHYKFIYSFHMPLFFVLAGFIAKDWSAQQSGRQFAKSRLMSRIIPFAFFNILLLILALSFPRDFPPFPLDSWGDYLGGILNTMINIPIFNIPTWFLMCLVSVEILHFLVFRFLRHSDLRIIAAMAVFYMGGYMVNQQFDLTRFGDMLRWNWWFMNEALVVYAFYLLGVLLRRRKLLELELPSWLIAALAILGIAAVYFSFDLNQGPFKLNIEAVVIVAAGHGSILWFPLTAIVGSVGLIAMARLLPPMGWMRFMGQNALILFCLNGVVYHHINGPLAGWFTQAMPQSWWSVSLFAAMVSALSLALAVPLVLVFNRWIPQLVGRPMVSGPLLPRLL